jgi:hypothetical protein
MFSTWQNKTCKELSCEHTEPGMAKGVSLFARVKKWRYIKENETECGSNLINPTSQIVKKISSILVDPCCGSGSGIQDPVPFDPWTRDRFFKYPGSRIPKSYF